MRLSSETREEMRERARQLVADGASHRDAGIILGVSKGFVQRALAPERTAERDKLYRRGVRGTVITRRPYDPAAKWRHVA